jgi:glycosyltransferase 2 family protein
MAAEPLAAPRPAAPVSWQRWAGLVISLACLLAALWGIDFGATPQIVQSADAGALLLAGVSVVLTLLAKALRWKVLLHSEKRAGWLRCFIVLNAGILLNTLFPARIGDLARAVFLAESQQERKVYVLGTIVIEKIWDAAALLLAAISLSWLVPPPAWLVDPIRLLGFASLGGVLALGLAFWQRKTLLGRLDFLQRWGRFGRWLAAQLRTIADNLERLREEKVLLRYTLWTVVILLLGASTNTLVFLAFRLPLSFVPALFLLVVLMAGVSVPSIPGRFGIFHYLTVISLATFGISRDLGLVCGVVLHLLTYLPTVLVGAYGLMKERTPWQWTARRTAAPAAGQPPHGVG